MEEPLSINGKKYVSTKAASRLTGYTSDYVGQLAREGRVDSKKFGRTRFVNLDQLLSYVKDQESDSGQNGRGMKKIRRTPLNAKSPKKKSPKVTPVSTKIQPRKKPVESIESVTVFPQIEDPSSIEYVAEAGPFLPELNKAGMKGGEQEVTKSVQNKKRGEVEEVFETYTAPRENVDLYPSPYIQKTSGHKVSGKKLATLFVAILLVATPYFVARSEMAHAGSRAARDFAVMAFNSSVESLVFFVESVKSEGVGSFALSASSDIGEAFGDLNSHISRGVGSSFESAQDLVAASASAPQILQSIAVDVYRSISSLFKTPQTPNLALEEPTQPPTETPAPEPTPQIIERTIVIESPPQVQERIIERTSPYAITESELNLRLASVADDIRTREERLEALISQVDQGVTTINYITDRQDENTRDDIHTSIAEGVSTQELSVSGDSVFDTDTLYIDSKNNRVGIGTLLPTALLDVGGVFSVDTNGQVTLGSINATGGLDITSDLEVGGDAIIIGALSSYTSFETPYITATSTTATSTFGGNVAITGRTDVTGTFNASGNSQFSTFTSSGLATLDSLSVLGFVDVAGDFAVNTNMFTVASSTGNTSIAGTLNVEGDATFAGGLTLTGPLSAPYFIATSSSATSTFAGSLNIGSGGLVYDVSAGTLGIGTTTPTGGATLGVSGDAYIEGNLTVTGDSLTLGASQSDTLVVNAYVGSSLVPNTNAVHNLGSPSFFWNDVYVDNITANNISASQTSISGTQSETFTINSDNSSSDAEDATLVFYRGVVTPNALLRWDSTQEQFEFTQNLLVQNETPTVGSTNVSIRGGAGQAGDIFNILTNGGVELLAIDSGGAVSITGTTTATGKISSDTSLEAPYVTATSTTATSTFAGNLAVSGQSEVGLVISGTWQGTAIGDDYLIKSGDWEGTLDGLEGADLLTLAAWYATTTDALAEGSNLYFTDARVDARINATSTIATLLSAPSLSTVGTITTGVWDATDIAVTAGGTGTSTLTGLIQGNGTDAFTTITDSSTVGQILRVTGASTYAWGALDLDDTDAFTGTLPASAIEDAYLINSGDDTTTGQLTAANFVASSVSATSTFAGGLAIETSGFVYDFSTNNVGIGTTTPSSRLDLWDGDLTTYGRLFVRENDNGNTAVAITRDADEGFVDVYSNGSITTEIRGNGHTYFNGGNVGIGTTDPGAKLDVTGVTTASALVARFANTSSSYKWEFKNAGATTDRINLLGYDSSGNLDVVVSPDGSSYFNGGNIGIGTTTPGGLLHVFYNTGDEFKAFDNNDGAGLVNSVAGKSMGISASQSSSYGGAGSVGIKLVEGSGVANAGVINFLDDGGVGMVYKAGKFGIGTAGPGTTLDVESSAANPIRLYRDGVNASLQTENSVGSAYFGINTSGNAAIGHSLDQTNASLQITSTGNVGIGTTDPSPGGASGLHIADTSHAALEVQSGLASDAFFMLDENGTNEVKFGWDASSNVFKINVSAANFTNNDFVVDESGEVGIGTDSPDYLLDVDGSARIGGSSHSTTRLFVSATNTAGSPAEAAIINMEGYEGRAKGIHYIDVSHVGEEWFSGLPYSTGHGAYQIGYDASGGQPEYAENSLLTVLSGGNVGIGDASPAEKLDVSGSAAFGGQIYNDGSGVTTGAGTANGFNVTLNGTHGTTLSTGWHYRVNLTTTGTGSDTGSSWIVWYDPDAAVWETRYISRGGASSNDPLLSISGSNLVAYHNHVNAYGIHYTVESLYKSDADGTPHALGADYQWQRNATDLSYTDGEVGIGNASPVAALHVDQATAGTEALLVRKTDTSLDGSQRIATFSANNSGTYRDAVIIKEANPAADVGVPLSVGQASGDSIVTTGNVGIGLAGPREALDVTGNIITDWNDRSFGTWYQAGTDYRLGFNTLVNARTLNLHSYSGDNAGEITFSLGTVASPSEKMRIATNGNVGIGDTSPDYLLDVAGTLGVDGAATFASAIHIPSSSYFIGNAAQGYRFNNAADTLNLMIISDAGNVSIPNGTLSASSFSGSGASLTSLNASQLTSGTVPNARITGAYTGFSDITYSGQITSNGVSTRDKLRVWSSGTYTIGMQSAFTHGYLNDYAMTFQMNQDNGRGFWWGDELDTQAQGAMSLTTDGRLYVNQIVNVGGAVVLTNAGTGAFSGAVTASSFSGSGASLTSLNASNLSSGTVPNARISGAYSGITDLTATGLIIANQGFETGENGGDSGLTGNYNYRFGYQEGGAWTSPYPDLVVGYHTGMKLGAHTNYGGTRFYNDHPSRAGATEILSIGDGDNHVRVLNNLIVTGTASASNFSGSGSGLTSLDASNLSSGTVPNARISGAYSGITTLDTGHGANELYDMNQHVLTSSAVTFSTIDTGQGANELYDMNQNLLTSNAPTFSGLITGAGSTDAAIEHGGNGSGNRPVYIDFTGDDTYTDYGLRIIRSAGANGQSLFQHRGTGDLRFFNNEAAAITFSTNSTERMRIASTGEVFFSSALPSGSGDYLCFDRFSSYKVEYRGSGCDVSSERFKDEIIDLNYGLADVMSMRPVSFVYKPELNKGSDVQLGFIAEEMESLIPELVTYDEDGIVEGVKYIQMTSVLTAAIQDIGKRIDLVNAPTTTPSITIDEIGRVAIGTSTPQYDLHVEGDVAAQSFVNISTRDAKKNIDYLSDEETTELLEKIRNTKIASYQYNEDTSSNRLRLGLIAEEAPEEIKSDSGRGIDIYKLSTFALAGVQAVDRELRGIVDSLSRTTEELERVMSIRYDASSATTSLNFNPEEIAEEERGLFSKTLLALGAWIEEGVTKFEKLYAYEFIAEEVRAKRVYAEEVLEVGSDSQPSGIVMYDHSTGEAYCVYIDNGAWVKQRGTCENPEGEQEEFEGDVINNSDTPNPPANDEEDTTSTSTAPVEEEVEENVATSTEEVILEEETEPVEDEPVTVAPEDEVVDEEVQSNESDAQSKAEDVETQDAGTEVEVESSDETSSTDIIDSNQDGE